MLEKILSLLRSGEEPVQKRVRQFDYEKLGMLFAHFPIGRRARYYPEYLRDAILETIVLGYRVNDQYIYANDGILLDGDQAVSGFRLAGGRSMDVEEVERVFLLVPDTSDQEKNLDYITRAELGPAGQFRQGNIITLMAESASHCTPTLDTTVSRRLILKEGPYANDAVVVLEPELTSLAVADKRKQQRIQAALKARLLYGKDGARELSCSLQDFSESSLRVATDSHHPMPPLQPGDRVFVEFAFAAAEPAYRFCGKVLRVDDTACVVRVEQIVAEAGLRKIQLMDMVEVKTRLLNKQR